MGVIGHQCNAPMGVAVRLERSDEAKDISVSYCRPSFGGPRGTTKVPGKDPTGNLDTVSEVGSE